MWKLRERLKDQKGFTLVEMLLVVAIIAILIAVSIPMVSGTLDRARAAVDDANFRDAAGLGSIWSLLTNHLLLRTLIIITLATLISRGNCLPRLCLVLRNIQLNLLKVT